MPLARTVPARVTVRERDEYVDFLRVLCVLGIVFGHWFSAKAWWNAGRVGVQSILTDIPGLWPGTWILMTVPVIFFVGGFSNSVLLVRSLESGQETRTFLVRRARRLLTPTAVFIGSWVSVEILLHVLDLGGSQLIRGVSGRGLMPFAPLWFVGVYLAVTVLSPITFALHTRFGAAVPLMLVASAVVVDGLRFVAQVPVVGWLNLALAWLLPHQLGYFYADGSLREGSRRVPLVLFSTGLLALLVLTSTSVYPRSIGGIPGNEISNMRPPTLCIVALSLCQIGCVLIGAPWVRNLLRSGRLSTVLTRLKPVTMSIYLWHMTALLLVLLICAPIGLSDVSPLLSHWWIERPIWIALGVVLLSGIIKVVGPAERFR